jgi:hypothetical protein
VVIPIGSMKYSPAGFSYQEIKCEFKKWRELVQDLIDGWSAYFL